MTIQQYKQQLYDASKEHSFFAQQALDRYDAATTDQERERARIDNIQHLAACHALQWALDKAIDFEQQLKQAKIDVLNELKKYLHTEDFDTPDERWKPESEFCAIIDELVKEIRAQ